MLIQAIFLANKVSQYAAALEGQIRSRNERSEALGLLYPAPLAHKVADADQRESMRRLLNAIVFVTLAVLPPAILIFAQVRFLPYQEELFTWLQRAAVATDIGLLWWLWPRIAVPHMAWREWFKTRLLKTLVVVAGTVFVSVFSVVFADFPGGTMGNLTPSLDSQRDLLGRKYDLSNRVLVHKEPSPEILAAHYRVICESRNGCDESVIAVGSPFWCKHAKPLQLKKRNFRSASLSGSTLCRADLEETTLHGANLWEAELRGADLSEAELHGASLRQATLHGANLRQATLHGANLSEAELHGADLWEAELHGADLNWATLHGTNLRQATLHGARLLGAELHGVDLSEAELHGAEMSGVKLHGADLRQATLYGAELHWAELHGVDLSLTKLHGADLTDTDFYLSDLRLLAISSGLDKEGLERVRRIINETLRGRVLERTERRIGNGKTYIEPQSLKDSMLCEGDYLHTQLKGSDLLDEMFVVNCPPEDKSQLIPYYDKLSTYLADLVCSDKSGHITEEIGRRNVLYERSENMLGEKLVSVKEENILDKLDCETRGDREG